MNKIIPNCSIALTKDNIDADPSLWKRAFNNGDFRIVYATPEILLLEESYFLRKVVPEANHPFKKKLIAVAFDECHCIKNWGVFRPYYRMAGTLRELLPDIPFIALSTNHQRIDSAIQFDSIFCSSSSTRIRRPQYRCSERHHFSSGHPSDLD